MRDAAAARPGRARRACLALALGLASFAVQALGLPPAYAPIVVEPSGGPARLEFDLRPAIARAKAEGKRLYVYLGAKECPFCRRYEAFLARNADALVPHFKPWLLVDLRSSLTAGAERLYLRTGDTALPYVDFQRAIGDQRTRAVVYPSVWVMDAAARPLMQMPAGTGTFETVEEQLEILNLVQ